MIEYELILVNGSRWFWQTEEIPPGDEEVLIGTGVLHVSPQQGNVWRGWTIRGSAVIAWRKVEPLGVMGE